MTRHYCHVPGLGTFLSHERASKVTVLADGAIRLAAPRREVAFTTRIRHDDGVLTTLVMQARRLTYPQAEALVRQEVSALRFALGQTGACAVGMLGELRLERTDDGTESLHLVPSARCAEAGDCGLADLHVPSWMQLERERRQAAQGAAAPRAEAQAPEAEPAIRTDRDNIHISLPRRWLRQAAVFALVVSAFFATPSRVGSDGRSEYAAMPFTTPQTFHLNTLTPQSWNDEWEHMPEADGHEAADGAGTDGLGADPDTATDTALADAPAAQPAAVASERQYYIIVASRATREQAEEGRRQLRRRGHEAVDIIEKDGHFRLYLNVFDVKDDALLYLDGLRRQEGFGDAWILPVRRAQTSQIIKNTYNDGNQLSMELSHPKHRTASDKG